MSANAVLPLVIRGNTPLYPDTIHAFLVAHQDDRWPGGCRPTYALTLGEIFGMRVCQMASAWTNPNHIRSTRLHGFWLVRCHHSHPFIFRMTYRYCYESLTQTPSFFVTVDLPYAHESSPNIYVSIRANMSWLDLLRADENDHMTFNALINADCDDVPDIHFNIQLYNRLITGHPFSDRVTVILDSESDSDAENDDAENERASIVGTIDV